MLSEGKDAICDLERVPVLEEMDATTRKMQTPTHSSAGGMLRSLVPKNLRHGRNASGS